MDQGKVFISYRRDDSAGYARAIFDHLVQRFSRSRVFMDVEAIAPGVPFDRAISEAVGGCRVLLVVIGKRWLERDAAGASRLHQPDDFVRLEVAAALTRDVRVIPVLLDGTRMPSAGELPDELRELARRNALDVDNNRFDSDMRKLGDVVASVIGGDQAGTPPPASDRRSWLQIAVGASALAAAAAATWRFGFTGRQVAGPAPAAGGGTGGASSAGGGVERQASWRFCQKCEGLYYDGYPGKGACPAGQGHVAQGYNFLLAFGPAAQGQHGWRYCQKCASLFFDGYPTKGACAAGGVHVAQGYDFGLEHDGDYSGQKDWRYCSKCQVMYFDGYPVKGVCAAGGSHVAEGYNFVLRYAV